METSRMSLIIGSKLAFLFLADGDRLAKVLAASINILSVTDDDCEAIRPKPRPGKIYELLV